MVFSAALRKQLGTLTAALVDPVTDLDAIFDVLVNDLHGAVSSFLGLTVTMQSEWFPVTLTAIEPDLALVARTSLALSLGRSAGARSGDKIVWYAGRPGAFVDLAADLERVPGPDGGVVLDGDLPVAPGAPREPGVTGLAELSVINQAVGVLITRGHALDQAKAELRRRAAVSLTSVTDVARHVLASTNAPPPHPVLAVTSEPCDRAPLGDSNAQRSASRSRVSEGAARQPVTHVGFK